MDANLSLKQHLTRQVVVIPLMEFGEIVDYNVEFFIPKFGEIRLHRIWPRHCLMSKRGVGELTFSQRERIVEIVKAQLNRKVAV